MLVQANAKLFEKGKEAHPANIIYSKTSDVKSVLPKLREVSQKIGYLKNQDFLLNEDEEKFSDLVADEMKSAFDVQIPTSLTKNIEAFFTTIVIHRNQIPNGVITNDFFPLLIHPKTDASIVVPVRYWSEEFLAAWESNK